MPFNIISTELNFNLPLKFLPSCLDQLILLHLIYPIILDSLNIVFSGLVLFSTFRHRLPVHIPFRSHVSRADIAIVYLQLTLSIISFLSIITDPN